MIDDLNKTVWCKLAPSKVHGIGVFAIRDIPKGQKLYLDLETTAKPIQCNDFTGLHPAILELIKQRWPLAFEGEWFGNPNNDARHISFMNHSADPNYDHHNDCALRDIKEGEEVFEDYGDYAPVDKNALTSKN